MANCNDLNQNPIVINFVDNAIIAYSDSLRIAATEFFGPGWSWRPGQIADGFNDTFLEGRGDFGKSLLRRFTDINRVTHRLALVLI